MKIGARMHIPILCLALVIAMADSARGNDEPLFAGVSRIDITPPMELKASLGGYGDRMNRPAIGVHDRVWAKALTLKQGDRRFCLVTADILGFPSGFKSAVMAGVRGEELEGGEGKVLPLPSAT